MLECDKCRLFWLSANTAQILSRGPCKGHNTYGDQPQDRPWVIPPNGKPLIWGRETLHPSHHATWIRGLLYCGHCGCHPIQGQTLRGLAKPCKNNPRSKYAVDTRRMIVTGNVRQGVTKWPQDKNLPGNELLGRYDMYPHPQGQESLTAARLEVTSPPTTAPSQPTIGQAGFASTMLRTKINCSGADIRRSNRVKDTIRDLRLRF